MTYQTLIVKDTRDVNKCWKWSIIVTLLCVVGTGLVVTFSFHALLDNFNTNCISGAKLAFKTTTVPHQAAAAAHLQQSGSTASASSSSVASSAARHRNHTETPPAAASAVAYDNVDSASATTPGSGVDEAAVEATRRWQRLRHNYSEQFREHFEPIVVVDAKLGVQGKLRRMTLASGLVMVNSGGSAAAAEDLQLEAAVRQQLAYNEEDIEFFDSQMIDELNTFWGPMAPCEYISFVPLIEAIVAIVWVTMFMMCGNGGRSTENFVDEPWRIVLPAFVFFALMTVVSAIHLVVLLARLGHFCAELKQHFHDQSVPCALLINQFSMNDDFAVPPSHNYVLAITFSWLRLLFWMLTVAVMTARCFTGTDFELVEMSSARASQLTAANLRRNDSMGKYGSRKGGGGGDDNNNNGSSKSVASTIRRPSSRALLSGYTSESSGCDEPTTAELTDPHRAMHRVQRVAQQAAESTDDDLDEEQTIGADSGNDAPTTTTTTVTVEAEHSSRPSIPTASVVHVNGVEFRPSAQLLQQMMRQNGGGSSAGRAAPAYPAIAEEDAAAEAEASDCGGSGLTPLHGQGGGGARNCRRLVNEIAQLRETKPKRLKRYLDSRA